MSEPPATAPTFEPCFVDLGDPLSRAELEWLWPFNAYLRRLEQRPSVLRVLAEAEPYFSSFPG
jgi:hypothetical protein